MMGMGIKCIGMGIMTYRDAASLFLRDSVSGVGQFRTLDSDSGLKEAGLRLQLRNVMCDTSLGRPRPLGMGMN